MGQSSDQLLIAIPTKTSDSYLDRAKCCEETWLKNSPIDYKFFRDAELGVDENHHLARQWRTKRMCQYALSGGYKFMLRAESDSYIWLDRFLKSDWDKYEAWSYYREEPTTFAATGYVLSVIAMKLVIEAEHFRPTQAIYQGREEWYADLWVGKILCRNHIQIGQNLLANHDAVKYDRIKDIPNVDNLISIHKVTIEKMREYSEEVS